jgi:peptidoglycan/LPS O-acetylase OafA/YrhL
VSNVTKGPGSAKSSRPRYLFLDFLRIFAMLLVFSFHLQVPGFGYGYLGVDIFFIISGFLITGIIVSNLNSSINSQWYKKFAIDRINRIYNTPTN